MSATIRVTAEDVELGEKGTVDITDTYVLITAGRCEQASVIKHANGTHVITVKNANGSAVSVQ